MSILNTSRGARYLLHNHSLRLCSTYGPNDNIAPILTNRNPRNLEQMRIARKPLGYHLEKPGRSFWNKLQLEISARHVTARVLHHVDGPVLEASTKEWALKKYLYRTKDSSAFINLARVFAQRCRESNITNLHCDLKPAEGGKVSMFLDTLTREGISLTEPEQFLPHRPWDKHRPPKPWETEHED